MENAITTALREFISTNYLFGDDSRMPADDESLLEAGVLDSTGVLELIEFLESQWDIAVSETETVVDNLGSISSLTRFVQTKLARPAGGLAATAAAPAD